MYHGGVLGNQWTHFSLKGIQIWLCHAIWYIIIVLNRVYAAYGNSYIYS